MFEGLFLMSLNLSIATIKRKKINNLLFVKVVENKS